MSPPRVVAVAPASPAERAGIAPGDEVLRLNGEVPRDIIRWRLLADEAEVEIDLRRGGLELTLTAEKRAGEPLGAEVRVARSSTRSAPATTTASSASSTSCRPGCGRASTSRTTTTGCRFLYGNFTTLTRFTEADLERVVDEGLSPLHVSIHATDPEVRAEMLRNRRGAHEPALAAGPPRPRHRRPRPGRRVPRRQRRRRARRHPRRRARPLPRAGHACASCRSASAATTPSPACGRTRSTEAAAVVDAVEDWQDVFLAALGRRLAFAADEYYLLAGRPFPPADAYEGFPMHEDGIGMARTFELEFTGQVERADRASRAGSSPGSTAPPAEGYRAPRDPAAATRSRVAASRRGPAGAVERPRWRSGRHGGRRSASSPGRYGARVLRPLLAHARPRRRPRRPGRETSSSAATPASPACWSAPTWPVARRRAGGPPLPAARRLPVRRALPRRHDARPTCPGRSRSSRPTASPCGEPSTATGR